MQHDIGVPDKKNIIRHVKMIFDSDITFENQKETTKRLEKR